MPLKAIVDSLDGIPETIRGEYTKGDDGKYRLNVEDAEAAFAAGLKTNRDQLLTEKQKVEARLKSLTSKLGDKAEERLAELLAAEERRREDAAKGSEQALEEFKSEVGKKRAEETATWQQRESALLRALEDSLARAELVRAITAAKGDAALLAPHGMNYLRVVEQNGQFRVEVIDPEKKTPRVKDGSGEPQAIEDVVVDLRKKYPRAFDGTGSAGGGAAGSGTGGGQSGIDPNLPPEQRLQEARRRGVKT